MMVEPYLYFRYRLFFCKFIGLLSLFLAAISLTGCERNIPQKIDVGLIVDVKTPGGIPAKNAAIMFQQQINKSGGIKINQKKIPLALHIEEIGINSEEASRAARRLIYQKNVVAIIGPNLSSAALAAATIAEVSKVPLISPGSTSSEVSDNKRFVIQLAFSDERQGIQISRYLTAEMNQKHAAVIYEISNPSSRRVAEAFIKQFNQDGGKLLLKHTYTRDNPAIDNILEEVVKLEVPVLVLPNRHIHIQEHANYLRKKQYQGVLFGSDTWSPTELKDNSDFNGSLMTHHWYHSMSQSHELSNQFVEQYKKIYSDSPTSMSALTYDALSLLAKAVSKQQSRKSSLIDEIKSTKQINGVTGVIGPSVEANQARIPIIIKLVDRQGIVVQ
ncbi:MAG: ABC transporter substrate-binding protein [Kangiellaceae bacterium]|nr:ABC transporter substrate-binding protein [Kangiellaceae bacterium]MCW9016567.1 ABC transporter substrate-binding protein [Kangiellaceae bacterium]